MSITTDPTMWVINEDLWDYGIEQNIRNEDFLQSKQFCGDRTYNYLSAHLFERHPLNGEMTIREYLIHSKSIG
jgi:hypothetical protein